MRHPNICRGVRYLDSQKCKLSYRQCLKRQGVDLKENGLEMARQINRNLTELFKKDNADRLYLQTWEFQALQFHNKGV